MEKTLPNNKKGFSLLEILMAVAIIAILGVIAIPRVINKIEEAKKVEAVNGLGAIRSAELRLHSITGQFVAASDEAGILTALGIDIGGGFYNYKIVEANSEDFLALATPMGPLSDWLKELGITKDGFIQSPYDYGGGGSGSGGGGSGGSGGSGSGGGGGGSGGGSGGGGSVSWGDVAPVRLSADKPPFEGYAENEQDAIDTLKLAAGPFAADGATTGAGPTHLNSLQQ